MFWSNFDTTHSENMSHVYVYTDGSYNSNLEVYSGAFLVYKGHEFLYKDSGIGSRAKDIHNVAGELSAVMHAAKWLKNNNLEGTIVYDYLGISAWIKGEWSAKNSYVKEYKKFMLPYYKKGIVKFKWVKGHNGDLGNHLADVEARNAIKLKKCWSNAVPQK